MKRYRTSFLAQPCLLPNVHNHCFADDSLGSVLCMAAILTARIRGAFAVALLSLILSAGANAATTLNMAAGTLKPGSTNNEFLLEFGLNGNGPETPSSAFATSGSFATGGQTASYPQSTNPSFTFDFSFSVAALSTVSLNPTYSAFLGSTTSSITLLQGTNVLATGVQTNAKVFVGTAYSLPSVVLQPNTQYDLVVTTLGIPSSFNPGLTGTQLWGQVAVDVSAPLPPSPVTVFSPAQGTSGVATTPALTWTAAALASYDIYLGTSPMPPLVAHQLQPGGPDSEYYLLLVSGFQEPCGFRHVRNLVIYHGSLAEFACHQVRRGRQRERFRPVALRSTRLLDRNLRLEPCLRLALMGGKRLQRRDRSDRARRNQGDDWRAIRLHRLHQPGQINAQAPSSVATGSQPIIVTTANGPSAPYTVTVNAVEPGLLAPTAEEIDANRAEVFREFGDSF